MNFYHTKNEAVDKVENNIATGTAIITGHTKEQINVGDELSINGSIYNVISINEIRDHAGKFYDESNRGVFFSVNCSFKKVIQLTQ